MIRFQKPNYKKMGLKRPSKYRNRYAIARNDVLPFWKFFYEVFIYFGNFFLQVYAGRVFRFVLFWADQAQLKPCKTDDSSNILE